jgi:uncharacterized damage-inducible protein DinB
MRADVEALIQRLDALKQQITWAMLDIDTADLRTAPAEDEWSPMEVLAHIKANDDIITPRIIKFLTEDNPTLPRYDLERWEAIAGYVEAPVDQTLLAFQRHRDELVWQLKRLPDAAWDRRGISPFSGDVTLYQILNIFADHEAEHLAQLRAMLGEEEADTTSE